METEDLRRSLQQHPFAAKLDAAHVAFLAGCTKNTRFAPGEYLAKEDQPANTLYLIRNGKASVEVHIPSRGAIPIETLEKGEVLGWSVVLPKQTWNIDVRALEPTLAFAIDGDCLRNKLTADHSFGYAMVYGLLLEAHRRLEQARFAQLDVYAESGR